MRRADISRERSLQHGDDHARLGRECGWRRRRVGLDRPFRLQRFARREQHVRIVSDGLWRRRRRSRQRSGQRWRGGRRLGPFCSRHHGIELGGGFRGQGRHERQSSGGRNSGRLRVPGRAAAASTAAPAAVRTAANRGLAGRAADRVRNPSSGSGFVAGGSGGQSIGCPTAPGASSSSDGTGGSTGASDVYMPGCGGGGGGPGSGSTAGGARAARVPIRAAAAAEGVPTPGGGGTGGKGGDGFAVVRAYGEQSDRNSVLRLALCTAPASAQIGASCSGAQGWSADGTGNNWYCNGNTSTVTYPAYWFGSTSTGCGSSTAGLMQWTGSVFELCNGSGWAGFGPSPVVSTYCTIASGLSCTGNSGATWSNSSAYTFVDVYICGGGGQGGGGGSCASGSGCSGGGGGGGGACVEQIFRASDLSSTVTVTLGSGGSSSSGDANGANGGTSTFGAYLTAYGGGGGSEGSGSGNATGGCGGDLIAAGPNGSSGKLSNVGFGGGGEEQSSRLALGGRRRRRLWQQRIEQRRRWREFVVGGAWRGRGRGHYQSGSNACWLVVPAENRSDAQALPPAVRPPEARAALRSMPVEVYLPGCGGAGGANSSSNSTNGGNGSAGTSAGGGGGGGAGLSGGSATASNGGNGGDGFAVIRAW